MSKNPKFIPKLQKLDLNSQKLYFLGGCHLAPPTTLHKKKPENTSGHHHIVKKKSLHEKGKVKGQRLSASKTRSSFTLLSQGPIRIPPIKIENFLD